MLGYPCAPVLYRSSSVQYISNIFNFNLILFSSALIAIQIFEAYQDRSFNISFIES